LALNTSADVVAGRDREGPCAGLLVLPTAAAPDGATATVVVGAATTAAAPTATTTTATATAIFAAMVASAAAAPAAASSILPKQISKSAAPKKSSITILDHVDLSESLSEEKYRAKLAKYQAKLNRLVWKANKRKISSVVVFEGWDASGKGSGIRRVTEAIDPRLYRRIPIAAPTDEERGHTKSGQRL
jgi:hypothetical protein